LKANVGYRSILSSFKGIRYPSRLHYPKWVVLREVGLIHRDAGRLFWYFYGSLAIRTLCLHHHWWW